MRKNYEELMKQNAKRELVKRQGFQEGQMGAKEKIQQAYESGFDSVSDKKIPPGFYTETQKDKIIEAAEKEATEVYRKYYCDRFKAGQQQFVYTHEKMRGRLFSPGPYFLGACQSTRTHLNVSFYSRLTAMNPVVFYGCNKLAGGVQNVFSLYMGTMVLIPFAVIYAYNNKDTNSYPTAEQKLRYQEQREKERQLEEKRLRNFREVKRATGLKTDQLIAVLRLTKECKEHAQLKYKDLNARKKGVMENSETAQKIAKSCQFSNGLLERIIQETALNRKRVEQYRKNNLRTFGMNAKHYGSLPWEHFSFVDKNSTAWREDIGLPWHDDKESDNWKEGLYSHYRERENRKESRGKKYYGRQRLLLKPKVCEWREELNQELNKSDSAQREKINGDTMQRIKKLRFTKV